MLKHMQSFQSLIETDCYTNGFHQEDTLTLLFLLSGELQVMIGGEAVLLQKQDLMALNPFLFFGVQIRQENTHFAVLRFPPAIYQHAERVFGRRQIHCAPAGQDTTIIKHGLAEVYHLYKKQEKETEILMYSVLYQLLFQLYSQYSRQISDGTNHRTSMNRSQEQILQIKRYIAENYAEKLTLQQVAQQINITPNYLSHYFRTNFATTFTEYLTKVRLHAAAVQLLHTSKNVLEIATDVGFSNMNSFYKSFYETFRLSPTEFRKNTQTNVAARHLPPELEDVLLCYRRNEAVPVAADLPRKHTQLHLVVPQSGTIITHNWQEIFNIGYASELLNARVQEQIRTIQKEIGFTHIRFHGVLNDNLHIYQEDQSGHPVLQFAYLDMLLDFLDSVQLMPYMEFSFIPTLLAKHHRTPFFNKACISEATSLEKWTFLIEGIVAHCMERYGAEIMRQWYFGFIGYNWIKMADTDPFMSEAAYFDLYAATHHAVKKFDSQLCMGGPAVETHLLDCLGSGNAELVRWIKICESRDCLPDFLAIHCYPYQMDELLSKPDGGNSPIASNDSKVLKKDPNYMTKAIGRLILDLKKAGYKQFPIYIDEWNSSFSSANPMNDTCYAAAYIVKNVLENFSRVAGMAQASVCDFSEEVIPGSALLYGGTGLLSCNGLKKSSYYAYVLLGRLGNEFLSSGPGWAMFRKGEIIQLFLYHFCHYDPEFLDLLADDRLSYYKTVFHDDHVAYWDLSFEGLTHERYLVKSRRIGIQAGSVFDKWLEMHAPASLTQAELEHLNSVSRPEYIKQYMTQEQLRKIPGSLSANDIVLIELEPQ